MGKASNRLGLALLLLSTGVTLAQTGTTSGGVDAAVAAFEAGDIRGAQNNLDDYLKARPNDLRALLLQGAILDSQRRYADAEVFYQHALKIAPNTPQILNNLANHYLASGDRRRARNYFEKTISLDSNHPNANLQLAQLSLEDKHGAQALSHLNRLSNPAQEEPAIKLLRARALSLTGQCSEAIRTAQGLQDNVNGDPRTDFSIGMIYAECKAYDQAERSFSQSLRTAPGDFDVIYNLGWAALRAGHAERAASLLEAALKEKPDDPDCLYGLAQAYLKLERPLNAAALLAKAGNVAPGRADVAILLAQVIAQLEYYQDAATAYTRYLTLKPLDDAARHARGLTLAYAGQTKQALIDLKWYVLRHPSDALGFYDLARVQTHDDRDRALQSFTRALKLEPKLTEARYGRALLNLDMARPSAALDDLGVILKSQPDDPRVLARIGQAYLALGRSNDAAMALQKALERSPEMPQALIQYARALETLGRSAEATAIRSRIAPSSLTNTRQRYKSGLIKYLSLPPADQRAKYLANLRQSSASDTGNLRLKLLLGSELLSDGQTGEGLAIFRALLPATTEAPILSECGRVLMEFEQYDLACRFFSEVLNADSSASDTRLDYSTALLQLHQAVTALEELDKTAAQDRQGDYYLLRAQILDALGRSAEAVDALNRGIHATPTKPRLYFQAVGFLLKHKNYNDALGLVEQSVRLLPDARELQLARAVTLIHLKRLDEAQKCLVGIEDRWPEWDRPYLLSGVLYELQSQSEEARSALETAIALGANTPEAFYYQALSIMHTAPEDLEGAEKAVGRAVALSSTDPRIYVLAGKIALARGENEEAIQRLQLATRLQPKFIPAHYALVGVYRKLGDKIHSDAEAAEIKRISGDKSAAGDAEFPMADFLFSVQPRGDATERH